MMQFKTQNPNEIKSAYRPQREKGGWQPKLAKIIEDNNFLKSSKTGNTSYKTRKLRSNVLFMIMNTLTKTLKFGLEDPNNLKVRHVEAIVNYWLNEKKLAARTIDMYLCNLRTLVQWMGKEGMVKSLEDYAPNLKKEYAATRDKSFTGNNINFFEIWQQIYEEDQYVARQLLLIKAFGLRKKEAIMFKPLIASHESYIQVFDGSKGGRPRTVPINSDFKEGVIAHLKNYVIGTKNPKAHLGNPDKDLEQNLKRYSYILAKSGLTKAELGATGHGLRAEYAIDQLIKRGLIPTVRGGEGKGLKTFNDKKAALEVAEELGHGRTSVMPAYGGKWIIVKKDDQYCALETTPIMERKVKTPDFRQSDLGL